MVVELVEEMVEAMGHHMGVADLREDSEVELWG